MLQQEKYLIVLTFPLSQGVSVDNIKNCSKHDQVLDDL